MKVWCLERYSHILRASTLIVLVALPLSWICSTSSAAERPHWLWSSAKRKPEQICCLRRTLELDAPPSTAALRVIAEAADVEVFLNGERIGFVGAYDRPQTFQVGSLLHAGENVVALKAVGVQGPSAVAVQISTAPNKGTTASIVSDETWRATDQAEQGWMAGDFDDSRWNEATSFGQLADESYLRDNDTTVNTLDDYTQWKQAINADAASDPAGFLLQDGFEIDLLRSAEDDEGSWISMTFDPQGRLIVSREDQGLLRLVLPEKVGEKAHVETVNTTLKECRGLAFIGDTLYANANNSKTLFRVRDSNGDGQYDETTAVYESTGNVGHGRNDLAIGSAGRIYAIHGDSVDLPKDAVDYTSPHREARNGERTREGHVVRVDPKSSQVELLVAGLRNPYGIALNRDGEMFNYDADAEYDMGSPWYRPTRVNHLLPGGDFGWRGVTKQWPPYYPDHPDAAPPTLDIGKGSPTAVEFGYESNFPPKYRDALFVLDWTYGRVLAVYWTPRGASYFGRGESFLRGSPLNVTDITFGPDGAMYLITGGRKTQSGLYRVRYVGEAEQPTEPTAQQLARREYAVNSRALRRKLETLHRRDQKAVATAWPHLRSADAAIRHAARIAIEHQPMDEWREHALNESHPMAALTTLMSLAAADNVSRLDEVLMHTATFALDEMNAVEQRLALRIVELCLDRRTDLKEMATRLFVSGMEQLFPHSQFELDRTLGRLLSRLRSEKFAHVALDLAEQTTDQKRKMQYLFSLRHVPECWSRDEVQRYLLQLASMAEFIGGEGMPTFVRRIREDALKLMGQRDRAAAEQLFREEASFVDVVPARTNVVRRWTVDDAMDVLVKQNRNRDGNRGREMFAVAQCNRCHRVGRHGAVVGPDLTGVSGRFSPRDLLTSIIEPSKVVAEKYQSDVITTHDGRVVTGRVVSKGDFRSPTLLVATDPLDDTKTIEIRKSEIDDHRRSPTSRMPEGLLDTLSGEEIADLLTYLRRGEK